jgi:hypothetical protein
MEDSLQNLYFDFKRNQKRLEEQLAQMNARVGGNLFLEGENSLLGSLVRHLFFPDEPRTFWVSNTSLKYEYFDLTLRPVERSAQLNLPPHLNLAIRGHLFPPDHPRPQLVVDRVMEVLQSPKRPFESELTVNCMLSGDHNHNNALTDDFLLSLPAISLETREKLRHWREYLEWKREIIEREISGVRYLQPEVGKQHLSFLIVCEHKNELEEVERLCNEEELNVFPLTYSTDEWRFNYRRDNRFFSGISLGAFEKMEVLPPKHFDKLLRNCPFESPVLAKVIFQLPESEQHRLQRLPAERRGAARATWAEQIPEKGFLANSVIGDFTVLFRQQQAMDMLERQEGFAPFLSTWIFDIRKAAIPDEPVSVAQWFMPNINDDQKKAVIKMLSAPDVALVQGPPGTGKTTVIGEAIYQLAKYGKTVLLASQANLAVDNALEKLAAVPEIRAIRLGRRHKLSAGGAQFAEDRVLMQFYNTLAKHCETRYFHKWQLLDKEIADLQQACDSIRNSRHTATVPQTKTVSPAITKLHQTVTELLGFLNDQQNHLPALPEKLQIALQKMLLTPLQQFQKWGIDFTLPPFQPTATTPHKSFDSRFSAVWKGWRQFTAAVPQLSRLKQQQTDAPLTAFERAELQSKLAVIEEAMVAGDDSKLAEWREIRKKLTAGSQPIPPEMHQLLTLFNHSPNGAPERDTAAIVAQIRQSVDEILQQQKRVENARQKLIERLKAMQQNLQQKMAVAGVATSSEQATKSTDWQQNLQNWQQRRWLSENDMTLPADKILQKLETRLAVQQRAAADESAFRQLWEPFLRHWHQQLSEPVCATLDHPHLIDAFLDTCNVVGITCNENPRLLEGKNMHMFDVAIIDEVSKATPPELLMPMLLARKTILVGDHRQLPPLFKERQGAWEEALENTPSALQSLLTKENFYRFRDMVTASLFKEYFEQARGDIKETLLTQYRMHPEIMAVVNHFYENKLRCGLPNPDEARQHGLTITGRAGVPIITTDTHAIWIDSTRDARGNLQYERQSGTSKVNQNEVEVIVHLLRKMDASYRRQGHQAGQRKAIGIISFYGKQIAAIRNRLRSERFDNLDIDVNTVDQFQGKERPIIIVSLVRHLPGGATADMSFVAKFERINVAFSRAKELLVIVGAAATFAECEVTLPNLNRPGSTTRKVYGGIITSLQKQNRFFTTAQIQEG